MNIVRQNKKVIYILAYQFLLYMGIFPKGFNTLITHICETLNKQRDEGKQKKHSVRGRLRLYELGFSTFL